MFRVRVRWLGHPKPIREYLYTHLRSTLVCITNHPTEQDAVSAGTLQQCFSIKNPVLLTELSHPMIYNAVISEVTIRLTILR